MSGSRLDQGGIVQPAAASEPPPGSVSPSSRRARFVPVTATGIIVARALGSEGRGELTAILTLVVVGVWIFSLGCTATA